MKQLPTVGGKTATQSTTRERPKGPVSGFIQSIRELPTKYPAVISGYIIYSYLFYTILRFFLTVKISHTTISDLVETFDALPFMWLLAVTLVKVIEIRSKLYESEKIRAEREEELRIKETQMRTMQEVVMGLQHHINNPLAIVMLSMNRLKRTGQLSPETVNDISNAEEAVKRITQALKDFSTTTQYATEDVGPLVGSIALPTGKGGGVK